MKLGFITLGSIARRVGLAALVLSPGVLASACTNTSTSETPSSRQSSPTSAPEPAAGVEESLERDAILEALRQTRGQKDTVFIPSVFNVEGNWAWVTAAPQSADGTQQYETESWLLQKGASGWEVAAQPCAEEGCDQNEEIARIRARFPAAPAAIFPQ
jgi:hypothetical protein